MRNRLAETSSPYLQQHAANPVHWQPWDEAALAQARREDKPILLSVGYSACHWCHVMAHESFEDVAVAEAMNRLFVNIKVDREERPDLDQVYQRAHALLTRSSGGWPLTLFLTPEGMPFFGGTYFPKDPAHDRPGFLLLLPKVADAYRTRRHEIDAQSARLAEWLKKLEPVPGAAPAPAGAPDAAWRELVQAFDPVHGGFGAAPKFPHAAELELPLRRLQTSNDPEARNVLGVTLARMAEGGIHDQLGGGFCRYSVDAEWTIPHFEKMLYDNAQLVGLYASFAAATGDAASRVVAAGIVDWIRREMLAPDAAFYAALDADSEGDEGRFYLWDAAAVRAALDGDEWAVVAPHYGLERAPNFEHRAWNLRVTMPLVDVAARLSITPAAAAARLASARARLLALRAQRVRPGLDDKILTSWNALAIAGLARAARVSAGAVDAEALAFDALDTLRGTAWRDARLRATRQHGEASLEAYLDDYAFLLRALVECMQLKFRPQDHAWAREVADVLLAQFEDRDHGGFYFTGHAHEALIVRQKPGQDGATPSGNGAAALALAHLAVLTGERRYADAARRTVDLFSGASARARSGNVTMLLADAALRDPPALVILDGERGAGAAWRAAAQRVDAGALVIDIGGCADVPAALVKGDRVVEGVAAFVCRDFACLPRIDDAATLESALAGERWS